MNRQRMVVVLSLWLAILLIACGDELFQPSPSASVAPKKYGVIHPKRPPLRTASVYTCGTVTYVGAGVPHGYRREILPLEGTGRPVKAQGPDSVTLGRFHYVMWDKETNRMLFEADCVIPRTKDATQFALRMVRRAGGRAHGSTTGTSVASSDGSIATQGGEWGDEHLDCWYDPADGTVECQGVYCYPGGYHYNRVKSPNGDGIRPSNAGGGGGGFPAWDCENGCEIWVEYGEFLYECEGEENESCNPEYPDYDDCCWDDSQQQWDWECDEGGGGDPQLNVIVVCDDSSLVRGSSISCTATGAGGALAISSWNFSPEAGLLPISRQTSETTWSGTMVIGGSVTATGTVGGASRTSGPVTVTVSARPLAGFGYFAYGTPTLASFTNTNPTAGIHLGYTDTFLNWESGSQIFGSGPNADYSVFASFPIRLDFDIFLNEGQFQSGSALWNRTPSGATAPTCTRAFIASQTGLRAAVLAHEGPNFESGSHTGWSKTYLENNKSTIQANMEKYVMQDVANRDQAFAAAVGTSFDQFMNNNASAVDPSNLGCNPTGISG